MAEYGREYFETVYDASGEGAVIARERGKMLLKLDQSIKRVLDVGCGFGDFLEYLERRGIGVVGVDISAYALERAREKITGKLLEVDVARDRLPFPDETFDAVGIFDVVEHLSSPKQLFLEVKRLLKPGGVVFLTTPNNQGWLRKILMRIFPDDPTHVNVRDARYWRKELVAAGFREIDVKGAILHGFPPLPRVRRLMRDAGIPVFLGPVFFPFLWLAGTLYLIARK